MFSLAPECRGPTLVRKNARVIGSGHPLTVQHFMAADVLQAGNGVFENVQKPDQVFQLGLRIGFLHLLVTAVVPVRKAPGVVELDADTAFVESSDMVRYTVGRHPLLDTPASADVVVAGVPGAGIGVVDTFTVFARRL